MSELAIKTIQLSEIKTKDSLQPRTTINFVIIDDYAQAMEAGQPFPPVDVVWDGDIYWLWDGYHRKAAYEKIDQVEVTANVTEGNLAHAEWLALGANKTHGFRRTNADKRRAVELALRHPEASGLSSRQLATHCGVSHQFVENIRSHCQPLTVTRLGADGRTINTANIGKRNGSTKTRKSPTKNLAPETMSMLPLTDLDQNQPETNKLAKLDEETQVEVISMIAEGGANSVKAAKKKIETQKQIEAIKTTEYPKGKYHVIVVDPPWKYDNRAKDPTHRAANPYPDMTIEEIKNWEKDKGGIPGLALDNCILWLWTTNAHMREAHDIANHWGFDVKTLLTWVKDKMGIGDWLRGKTEHCLMCVKGKPVINLTNQTTVISGPLREHSRKPDEFYQMVDELCPGQKIDIFSREPRKDWDTYGNESEKFTT